MQDKLKAAVSKAQCPEWYLEVFGEALGQVHDVDRAIKVTDRYIKNQPYPPSSEQDQVTKFLNDHQAMEEHVKGNEESSPGS